MRRLKPLTLKIPHGVTNGMRIRIHGVGEAGPRGGPPGDLYVKIHQTPHPELDRRGDDLHLTRRIPLALAREGGTIEVTTLDGVRTVRIPRGQITDALTLRTDTVRVTGLGVKRRYPGKGRGDLVVHLQVQDVG